MNNALAIPNDNEFKTLETIARRAAICGLYGGVGNEHKIFMVLLSAMELGIKPMEALNGGLWNIQGKIEISSRLMSSMIRRQGHSINIIECNSEICIIEGKRKDNGDSFKSQFSIEDAKKAGLIRNNRDGSSGIWGKYTEDMLYSRALSRLARRLFADVIGSAYVEGEINVKSEVIETKEIKNVELSPSCLIEHKENDDETKLLLNDILANYDVEEHDQVKQFLNKYCDHYKKTFHESLLFYSDPDKFGTAFKKWKVKQEKLKNESEQ